VPPSPINEALSPEVPFEEIRKGYEVAPGQFVSMTREEVAALAPERSRVLDVEQFVDIAAVDPIYFESRYYVVAGSGVVLPIPRPLPGDGCRGPDGDRVVNAAVAALFERDSSFGT